MSRGRKIFCLQIMFAWFLNKQTGLNFWKNYHLKITEKQYKHILCLVSSEFNCHSDFILSSTQFSFTYFWFYNVINDFHWINMQSKLLIIQQTFIMLKTKGTLSLSHLALKWEGKNPQKFVSINFVYTIYNEYVFLPLYKQFMLRNKLKAQYNNVLGWL